jgi:hypothetical protein
VAIVAIVGSVLLIPVIDDPLGDDASVESLVVTGQRTATEPVDPPVISTSPTDEDVDEALDDSNIARIGRVLFTDYAVAFEITAALLTIAVVGAVLLSRRPTSYEPLPPEPVDDRAGPDETDADDSDDAEVTS